MKRIFTPFAILMASMLTLASCLGSDKEEVTLYSDAAISAFTLGTLNQIVHTTATNGSDSTYIIKVVGSAYKFYIDQVSHTIANVDSLPYGTDVEHVVCTVTTRNSGTATIQNLAGDSVKVITSSDSIDFSLPRVFVVYSQDGTNNTKYTVKLNVKQELPGQLLWSNRTVYEPFKSLSDMRAVAVGRKVMVIGACDGSSSIWTTDELDGTVWTQSVPDIDTPLPEELCRNIAVKGDALYALVGNTLMRTTDGNAWEVLSTPAITCLLGASPLALYGMDSSGALLMSADDGKTWESELLDSESLLLPTSDVSCVYRVSGTNSDAYFVSLIGNRSVDQYPDDGHAMMWTKVEEGKASEWLHTVRTGDYPYDLPRLSHLSVTRFDKGMLALGGGGIGSCEAEPFSHFLYCLDGINWKRDSRFFLKGDFDCNGIFGLTTDSSDRLWIVCGGSGQVWRARLTQ